MKEKNKNDISCPIASAKRGQQFLGRLSKLICEGGCPGPTTIDYYSPGKPDGGKSYPYPESTRKVYCGLQEIRLPRNHEVVSTRVNKTGQVWLSVAEKRRDSAYALLIPGLFDEPDKLPPTANIFTHDGKRIQ